MQSYCLFPSYVLLIQAMGSRDKNNKRMVQSSRPAVLSLLGIGRMTVWIQVKTTRSHAVRIDVQARVRPHLAKVGDAKKRKRKRWFSVKREALWLEYR